jgi:hypothetical protein
LGLSCHFDKELKSGQDLEKKKKINKNERGTERRSDEILEDNIESLHFVAGIVAVVLW